MPMLDTLWSKRLLWLRDLARSVALALSEAQVCERAAQQLALDASGISFALIYLSDSGGDSLTLCESVGLAAGAKDSLNKVSVAAADADARIRAMAAVLRSGQPAVVEAAPERDDSPTHELWPTLPALVVPLDAAEPARATGLLIAALQAGCALTGDDRIYLELAAAHIGTGLRHVRGCADARAEADFARALAAALRRGEDRFRFLAEMIPSLIWTASPDGKITYVNTSTREEKTPGPSLDSRAWVEKIVHPSDRQRYLPIWNEAIKEGKAYEAEIRVQQADGVYRWGLTRAVPQKDESGNVLAWFGTTTDIHDLKVAQEQLREVDAKKNEFLAVLAHELRNPLAPICNSLYLLRASCSGNAAIAHLLEIIERQFNHMIRLVDDLLDLSRITRGKIELRKERVELAGIIKSAVETSRPVIDAAHHTLDVSVPSEPLLLYADAVRLEQVIANLLNNAAKYTEDGGRIWLSARQDGREAVVSVRDTGLGISADVLPQIFDMFAQAQRTVHRAQGGLGIGLSLARFLVQLHGGHIEAFSEGRGKGSEFTVRLPLASATDPMGEPLAEPQCAAHATLLSAQRILVVDDNRDAAECLAMVLKCLGASTRVVFDGRSALSEVKSYRPSVVLLDLGMPGMDGYAVAEKLREDDKSHKLVLIAVSGWGQPSDRQRSQAAGFDHHLVKPVDTTELLALLTMP